MAIMLVGASITTNVYAIQPWTDGVKPMMVRMAEIDQSLSFNLVESMSEFLTATDVVRLASERDSLLLEKASLMRMLEMSIEIRDSEFVNYAVPSGTSFNSALHTDAQARQ